MVLICDPPRPEPGQFWVWLVADEDRATPPTWKIREDCQNRETFHRERSSLRHVDASSFVHKKKYVPGGFIREEPQRAPPCAGKYKLN